MADAERSKLRRAIRNPGYAASVLLALGKGYFYKRYLPLRGIRFSAGRNFLVFGRLTVRGPGKVEFGDNVNVSMHVTPFTHDVNAVISVGDHCFLNGVRFGCATRIQVGADCILAEARIMDSNFHSTRADRWNPDAPVKTAAVILERNVWVAADAGILPGTRIGENSVVGFAAVCNGSYPANSLIAGNPAIVVRQIEQAPQE
ncbi:acyltransferase [Gemmatimonas groenlandica]|uniref:Acyltransferase n=1 Tax=Gemmatimonas groenlandica TaxID=2732249 RepID=A0A6M4IND5_9BACT|nr:acyltransferase [Gemmatimonas groenlandica]QJR36230.1 acyltransferase [Gemmatimonas groenlandica]